MLQTLSDWLTSLGLTAVVNGHEFAWPLCETLHFMGMATLFGCIGVVDLRILGVGKGLPVAALEKFIPIGIAGFLVNLITGFIFVASAPAGAPLDYFGGNLAFQLKMGAILLAGLNAVAFYVFGFSRQLALLGPNGDASSGAKVVALLSLVFWALVILFGRLIMYNDTLLYTLGIE
jgi:hypothetical protein